MNEKVCIGLMSGTSADGLTIAAITLKPFKLLYSKNYPYSPALQKKIISAHEMSVHKLMLLHYELGKMYRDLTKKFIKEFKIKNIFCISSHGQTVISGLQIGTGAYMAAEFAVPVVDNFREKDIALGGLGAPLMPFFDEYVFGGGAPVALLNLGGIANIGVVGKNIKTYGFDTGPANTLMDYAMQKVLDKPYDKDGALAAKGVVNEQILEAMLKHKYFAQKSPKALDRNDFGLNFLNKHFPVINKKNIADVMATLNMFTARTAADEIRKTKLKRVLASGGGALNKTLISNIQRLLPGVKIDTELPHGLTAENKEAAGFALLGALALTGRKNSCPRATGAKKQTILGSVNL